MSESPKSKTNKIVEVYRGVNIREYNKVSIRLSEPELLLFEKAKTEQNLSAKKALKKLGILCYPPELQFEKKSLSNRDENRVYLRLTRFELKKIIDAKVDNNYTVRQAIQKLRILCPKCTEILPVKFTENAESR